ncbi:hypothetical protein [Saliphagus infecundisoli]|uniref:Uncharacterized protein n=1 Tax=Saliphagus infecundisoli TaxID=1849069 RepID=A0ABD5QID5_9EURY|nr:hypothetical protein [Saliphagus infecundisoli]
MEEVTGTKLYEYTTEVIVEVMGIDSGGDFAVASYQFSYDNGEGIVRAKTNLESAHKPHVESALEDAGYTLKQTE